MKKNHIYIISAIFILIIACNQKVNKNSIGLQGKVFGTTYHIKYLNTNVNYKKSIDSLFNLVNKSFSTYIPTSDISKINRGEKGVLVDHFFIEVFKKSKRIYKETEEYFDPTVGDLINAWGFGPKKEKIDLDSIQVKKLMKFVGFNKVSIEKNKIKKQFIETYLDFNSIAKGFGIDVIARFLESKNIKNYLVEIGGEIRTRGKNSKGKYWKIGIDNPNKDGTRSISNFISLSDKSMATSGNYRKYRIGKNGKKYVHTINPKTGFAIESNLLSVSVIGATDCADVDAYATAFMAMGLEKAKVFLQKHPEIKVIFMYKNSEGKIAEYSNLKVRVERFYSF